MLIRKTIKAALSRLETNFDTQNVIEISKSSLLNNLNVFAEISGLTVIPVLKSNAYGHGIKQVAVALKDNKLPYIAVDGYFEALRIREISNQPILIMGDILSQNFMSMKYDNFAFVVQNSATIHALGATGKRIKVHLECNTGMNRYGVNHKEVPSLVKIILSYKNLKLEGIMSHLADSDGENEATVNEAVVRFDACVDTVLTLGASPTIFHIAQSAGSLKAKSKYANSMRLGIGLYGINPFSHTHTLYARLARDLKPAMKIRSTISKIAELQKGEQVSYNYTFTAPKTMKIGVLPLGYAEGVNRGLSNVGLVQVGDEYAPIIGRVCMNHTMIDLSRCKASVGDRVIVYSDRINDKNSIDAIAKEHDLFSYSLLTALSSDVRRVLIE